MSLKAIFLRRANVKSMISIQSYTEFFWIDKIQATNLKLDRHNLNVGKDQTGKLIYKSFCMESHQFSTKSSLPLQLQCCNTTFVSSFLVHRVILPLIYLCIFAHTLRRREGMVTPPRTRVGIQSLSW